jgi:hypothetical protein
VDGWNRSTNGSGPGCSKASTCGSTKRRSTVWIREMAAPARGICGPARGRETTSSFVGRQAAGPSASPTSCRRISAGRSNAMPIHVRRVCAAARAPDHVGGLSPGPDGEAQTRRIEATAIPLSLLCTRSPDSGRDAYVAPDIALAGRSAGPNRLHPKLLHSEGTTPGHQASLYHHSRAARRFSNAVIGPSSGSTRRRFCDA